MKKEQIAFRTRARLLCQLGEQLIKSEDIALLELIKNSYDADATYCDVLMENVADPKNGRIVIDDDGCGMSAERILHTWLEIGTNFKESLASDESTKRTPKFKRMRLGEKGIGRFGVHRLGHKIDVYSKSADSRQEAHLAIDWRSAEKAEMIEDVPVSLTEDVPQYFKGKKTGTHIVISNLKGEWTRKMARDVARAIATLNSPFEERGEFVPMLKLTGQSGEGKWIDGIVTFDEIRAKSLGSFEIALKGNRIKSFEYHFTPWKVMDKLQPRMVKWDSKHVEARLITEDDDEIDLSEIGEVSFKGLVFDLDTKILKLGIQDVMGFKEYLQVNGGVRVYRDNMRVLNYGEPDDDWLDLNFRRVNQPTRKVSSNVIIAAVGLSRESSGALREKANREGFLKNEAFMKLRDAILFALGKVELERSADKDRIRAAYGKKAEIKNRHVTMNDLRADVETYVKNKVAQKKMLQCIDRVENQFEEFADSLIKSAGAGLNLSMVIHQMEKIIKNVKAMLRKRGHESDVAKQIDSLALLIEGYSILIRESDRKVRNLDEIVEQSVYNVGFRLSAHKIDLVDAYKKRGKCPALCTENHAVNAMLNLFDNSIWWLGYSKTDAPKISEGNGPVVIVLWTKHCDEDIINRFNGYLKSVAKNPYFVVCMAKSDCKDVSGNYSVSRIKWNLSQKLADANVIGLHTTWENAVFKGSVKLSERIAAIAAPDENWQTVVSRMFYKLYKANSEKVELKTLKEQFLSACSLFGAGLLNAINFELSRSSLSCGKKFALKEERLAGDSEAKLNGLLNAFLYYDKDRADPNVPGTVYAVRSGAAPIKCGIATDFFKVKSVQKVIQSKVAKDVRLCKIVVTPSCDCAQKKEFRSGGGEKAKTYDRVVWALMVNRALGAEYIERKYRKARCYSLEGFEYDGGIYDLLIDLDTLGFEVLDLKKQSRLFTLTSMVLADVQSKLANQLNRMGVVSV